MMNKTKIEWTDYTWNPMTGCLRGCSYCYARKIAERFRGTKAFPNGFDPTYNPGRFLEPYLLKRPSKIFTCSMSDSMGPWWPPDVQMALMTVIKDNPRHTFQLLTKYPERLCAFNPWPRNCWVGATVTSAAELSRSLPCLARVQAGVRFISFEPLLESVDPYGVDFLHTEWIIIGAQTNPLRLPEEDWILEIMNRAADVGTSVFLKDNLRPLGVCGGLRQEFPSPRPYQDSDGYMVADEVPIVEAIG